MKTVTITRAEAHFYCDHFTRCARPPRSGGEDKDLVQKFKYAVGRNYQRMQRIVDETAKLKSAIAEHLPLPPAPPELAEYERERQAIILSHARRNEAGQVVAKRDEQTGEVNPVIPTEAHAEVQRLIDELRARYAGPIEVREKQIREMEAAWKKAEEEIDAQQVEVALFTFPFADVPEAISGTHLADLSIMLTGCPALDNETADGKIIDLTPLPEVATNCAGTTN
jgi:hypothetical protein